MEILRQHVSDHDPIIATITLGPKEPREVQEINYAFKPQV